MADLCDSNETRNLALRRLHHFLYLGAEGNFYQPGKKKFALDNVHSIESMLADGKGEETVRDILRFLKDGLSICPDAPIYALAICTRSEDKQVKSAAYSAFQEVATTSEELFAFVRYLEEVSSPTTGWGRSRRTAVGNWYHARDGKTLAAQATQVCRRHRWTHKDVVRLAHVKAKNPGVDIVLKYTLKGMGSVDSFICQEESSKKEVGEIVAFLKAVHTLKHTTDEQVAARLIETHNLTFEHIPSNLLKSKEVWTCLASRLPVHILLRQLPRLNRLGFLKPSSLLMKVLLERLRNENVLSDGHLGPVETFLIMKQYEMSSKAASTAAGCGRGQRHKKFPLEEALHTLHMATFKMVPSTGKRYLVVVDVRNQMPHSKVVGLSDISPADATSLLLMSLARAEGTNLLAMAFSGKGLTNIDINSKMTMADITKRMRETPMGHVNIATPILWALELKRIFDIILICTDNQTQPGDVHPAEALKEYRRTLNTHTRLVVCGMTSPGFSLAPPDEPGMLDIAGFDEHVLQVIQDFARNVF